jgi:thymidylate synthase
MSKSEETYLNAARDILENGNVKSDRTGTGTISKFGVQMRFNLQDGFPLLTTKKVPFGLIKSELLWFLKGDTNIQYLLKHKNHIWDEWAIKNYFNSPEYTGPDMTNFGLRATSDPDFNAIYQEEKKAFTDKVRDDDAFAAIWGDLGDVYGAQWRHWQKRDGQGFIDQIHDVVEMIKKTPDSRRMLVTAWNPEDIPTQALPPCHSLFQFYVADNKLSLQLYQRSGDFFLGIPFNIASYSLLLHMVAAQTGLEVGEFIHTIGDAHIYSNHIDQIKEQLTRPMHELPTLKLNSKVDDLSSYEMEDIVILNYESESAIKAPVAV